MAVAYLHGAETIEVPSGVTPIRASRTAVIGLVGSDYKLPLNEVKVIRNEQDAADLCGEFRNENYTIPKALKFIFAQGAATVLVVNTFDTANMTTEVEDEVQIVTNRKVKLGVQPLTDVVITNNAGDVTYEEDTDYTVGEDGITFTFINTAIANGASLKFSYFKADFTAWGNADVIGVSGDRTGLYAFRNAFSEFGFSPKILIAPYFSSEAAVATVMQTEADYHRAIFLVDSAETVVADAITSRGLPASEFGSNSDRGYYLFPQLEAYNPFADENDFFPYSPFMAGVICRTDNELGYWNSPSNKTINQIFGTETPVSWQINRSDTDANALNENGIATAVNGFGTGMLTWGNRNASFPANSDAYTFLSVRRTADVLHESLEIASLQFIDKPINQATIDAIRDSANAFIRTLIGRGALVDGECTYDPNDNPVTELAQGKLVFRLNFMPPPPCDRLTFKSYLDINLLKFR